jgi:dTDP-4-amino-4,6-dideoxygalactose transaminase
VIRLIPPVAVPFGPAAVAASLIGQAAAGAGGFREQLAERFAASRVQLAGSGRGALAAALGVARPAGGGEVLVPAYTCWSVPAAAVAAGWRVRLYDLDPRTFLPAGDLAGQVGPTTAAVVLADLLSAAPGFEEAAATVAARLPECLLIEDRAQSWPARASSSGLTLLSFGRGKPLPLGHGGALLSRGNRTPPQLPEPRPGGARPAAALALAALLGHPQAFRLPAAIPALGIGTTIYDPAIDPASPFYHWQERLGARLLRRMDEFQAHRAEHAARLAAAVPPGRGWSVGPWTGGPIRLPLLAPDRATRDAVLAGMRRRGVAASALYPGTLLEIPALRPHLADPPERVPGAREIADRLLALPVYPTLGARDAARVAEAFVAAVKAEGGGA